MQVTHQYISLLLIFTFHFSIMGNLSCIGRNKGKKKKKHGARGTLDEHEDDALDGQGRDPDVSAGECSGITLQPEVKVTTIHYELKRDN